MKSWIPIWIFIFSLAMMIAILSSKEGRRDNIPMILLMAASMITSLLLFYFN
ncbi:MAG: hypothetical protein ACPGN6_09285 [Gammaproteobacteria bacterium]